MKRIRHVKVAVPAAISLDFIVNVPEEVTDGPDGFDHEAVEQYIIDNWFMIEDQLPVNVAITKANIDSAALVFDEPLEMELVG